MILVANLNPKSLAKEYFFSYLNRIWYSTKAKTDCLHIGLSRVLRNRYYKSDSTDIRGGNHDKHFFELISDNDNLPFDAGTVPPARTLIA